MTTLNNYITQVLPTKPFSNNDKISLKNILFVSLEKGINFIHNHPTITKIIEIAGLIFGLYLFTTSFSLFFVSNLKATIFCCTGTALSIISFLALKLLKILAPPKIDKKNHCYECAKTNDAKLYYEKDIPILSIKTQDPYKAGFSHGYLLGKQINELRNIWTLAIQKLPNFLFIHTSPKATEIPKLIEKIKNTIPKKYLTEMQGLVDGFNKWADEKGFFLKPRKLTLNELILFHLEPDIRHFNHLDIERKISLAKKHRGVACTAIVAKDPIEGNVFASTTDWPTFGCGLSALIILRNNKTKQAEIGLPGFIGTLCGMNETGFSLRMNICDGKTQDVEGMPNSFLTRLCLEKCKKVKDVKHVIENHPSLGPFHIIAADEKDAQAFFIKQGKNLPYRTRNISKQEPLIVTNFRYDTDEEPTNSVNFSEEREKRIKALFLNAKKAINPKEYKAGPLLISALKLPFVNNIITAHSMILHPKTKSIEVCFDNAYASKNKHQTLNLF